MILLCFTPIGEMYYGQFRIVSRLLGRLYYASSPPSIASTLATSSFHCSSVGTPSAPSCPAGPCSPSNPSAPGSPCGPCSPSAPSAPAGPFKFISSDQVPLVFLYKSPLSVSMYISAGAPTDASGSPSPLIKRILRPPPPPESPLLVTYSGTFE